MRYVNRDKFIENLKTTKYGETTIVEIGIALDKAKADVVPKSEVERLKAELDDKQFRCDSCDRIMLTGAEHLACVKQAKYEVAREIFEEIEELKWIPFEYEHYVVGYDDIAELKKKYTEVTE